MSTKLKVVGLGLLAMVSVGALAAMNASANTNGHFVTQGNVHAEILGLEEGEHELELTLQGLENGIVCNAASYSGTTTHETEPDITITPSYGACYTTGSEVGTTVIHTNGCTYTLRVAKSTTNATEQTASLVCPEKKSLEITHPSCTINVAPQVILTGLTYTTEAEAGSGLHLVTLDSNVQFSVTYEGKTLCQMFLGTGPHLATLNGSVTVRAYNTLKQQAHFTAT
jgi:hypothetical protein